MSNEMVIHQSAPLVPYQDMERMAAVIAQSGLFGVKNPTQALALMLLAQAEGMHPVTAARDYHIIGTRPSMKADTMLARFQFSGGKVEWTAYTEKEVTGVFSHPASPNKVPVTWTIEQANKIVQEVWADNPGGGRTKVKQKITDKDVWKHYPGRCCAPGDLRRFGPSIPASCRGCTRRRKRQTHMRYRAKPRPAA